MSLWRTCLLRCDRARTDSWGEWEQGSSGCSFWKVLKGFIMWETALCGLELWLKACVYMKGTNLGQQTCNVSRRERGSFQRCRLLTELLFIQASSPTASTMPSERPIGRCHLVILVLQLEREKAWIKIYINIYCFRLYKLVFSTRHALVSFQLAFHSSSSEVLTADTANSLVCKFCY